MVISLSNIVIAELVMLYEKSGKQSSLEDSDKGFQSGMNTALCLFGYHIQKEKSRAGYEMVVTCNVPRNAVEYAYNINKKQQSFDPLSNAFCLGFEASLREIGYEMKFHNKTYKLSKKG